MAKQRWTFLPSILCGILVLSVLVAVLHITALYDNKYTAGPPYGKDGVFVFTEQDLEKPLLLVDGWLLSIDGDVESETFVGQYSNFAFPNRKHSPFGSAVYRLTLKCPGTHALLLELPEIFTQYSLSINGTTKTTNGSMVSFLLTNEAELKLTVENQSHYYSGLYYPPILGSPEKIVAVTVMRTTLYTTFCVSALTLALFSAVLWLSRARDGLFLHFGLLCLAFFVACLHPFLWKSGLNSTLWYAIEDFARIFMLVQAVEVGAALAGWSDRKWFCNGTRIALYSTCITCFVTVYFIIPRAGGIINLYGRFVDLTYFIGWLLLCASAVGSLKKGFHGSAWLAGGCCAFGMGFLVNLVNNNHFEPIKGAWQTEYAGFCMVLLFGLIMIRHNREIILQNRKLVSHMEQLIEQRTSELHVVLLERKNFFSDMAHNLKAPIEAVHGFISMIREGNLYLDDELQEYIGYIESENNEIRRRVQSLSVLNTFDRITAPVTVIEINSLLAEVERKNRPETEAAGIYLTTHKLDVPATVTGQKEKLLILFENLIYNALAFTLPDGKITIEPHIENDRAVITVSDTGCGITPEKLPHIFERFYVGRENENEGSGLGLYIAKLTVEEIGGSISVQSTPKVGTVFTICLPLKKER